MQTTFIHITFNTLLAVIVYWGYCVNFNGRLHRIKLASQSIQLQSKIYELEQKNSNDDESKRLWTQLNNAVTACTRTLHAVKVFDDLNPLRILGIVCEATLAITILSTTIVVYTTVFQYAAIASANDDVN